MMKVELIILGAPVGKGRPRVTMTHTYTPKKTKDYERLVQECWLEQSNKRFPDNTALEMDIKAYFPIPKSVSKKKHNELDGAWYTHKCDIDNLVKIICDALNGCAYDDDARIAVVSAAKRYSETPRVEVSITEA